MAPRLIIIAALATVVAVTIVFTETQLAAVGARMEQEKQRTLELREALRRQEFEVSRLKAPEVLRRRAPLLGVALDAPGRSSDAPGAAGDTHLAATP